MANYIELRVEHRTWVLEKKSNFIPPLRCGSDGHIWLKRGAMCFELNSYKGNKKIPFTMFFSSL